jgi:hypothetical protein
VNHRFRRIPKGGAKGRKGQTKAVRQGARNPGASTGHGSIRRPF